MQRELFEHNKEMRTPENLRKASMCIRVCMGPSCSAKSKDKLESWFIDAITNHPKLASMIQLDREYCFGQCFKGPNAAFYSQEISKDDGMASQIMLKSKDKEKHYLDLYFEHYIEQDGVNELITYHLRRISALLADKGTHARSLGDSGSREE